MTINNALKAIRQYHGLKQVELARKLNVSRSFVCEIEGGGKQVGLEVIKQYAVAFKLPPSSILLLSELDDSDQVAFMKTPRKFVASKVFKILEWLNDKTIDELDEDKSESSISSREVPSVSDAVKKTAC